MVRAERKASGRCLVLEIHSVARLSGTKSQAIIPWRYQFVFVSVSVWLWVVLHNLVGLSLVLGTCRFFCSRADKDCYQFKNSLKYGKGYSWKSYKYSYATFPVSVNPFCYQNSYCLGLLKSQSLFLFLNVKCSHLVFATVLVLGVGRSLRLSLLRKELKNLSFLISLYRILKHNTQEAYFKV